MAFYLTDDQMAVLFGANWSSVSELDGSGVMPDPTSVVGQALAAGNTQGAWRSAYLKLYDYTTITTVVHSEVGDFYDSNPAPGMDPSAWLWLQAAADANAGIGYASSVIRNYTAEQYKLRFGKEVNTDPGGPIDAASNGVATAVFNELLSGGNGVAKGRAPDIFRIETNDVGAIASGLFQGDFTPWSGTVLFSYLGTSNYFEKLVLKSNKQIPNDSDTSAIASPQVDTYDLISVLHTLPLVRPGFFQAPDAAKQLADTEIKNRLGLDGTQTLLQTLAADTDTYLNGFYNLKDQDVFQVGARLFPVSVLDQVKFGLDGFGIHAVVGTLGNGSKQTIIISNVDRNLVNAGSGDDTVSVSGPPPQVLENPVVYPIPGTSVLDGGGGSNTLRYNTGADVKLKVTFEPLTPAPLDGYPGGVPDAPTGRLRIVKSSSARGETTDLAYRFQTIILGAGNDTLVLDKKAENGLLLNKDGTPVIKSIDGGGGSNTLDLSNLDTALQLAITSLGPVKNQQNWFDLWDSRGDHGAIVWRDG